MLDPSRQRRADQRLTDQQMIERLPVAVKDIRVTIGSRRERGEIDEIWSDKIESIAGDGGLIVGGRTTNDRIDRICEAVIEFKGVEIPDQDDSFRRICKLAGLNQARQVFGLTLPLRSDTMPSGLPAA